jgi:hypothetical protein
MALVVFDRVKETSNTVNNGTLVLDGAQTGYQSFAVVGNGNQTYYTISEQQGSDWEVGIGTYYSANTSLSRDVILASSNGNAVVTLLSGQKDVFITYPSEKAVYANNSPDTANYVLTASGTGVPPTWQALNAALSTGNSSIVLNNTNITSNATIAAGQNGFSVGPVTTANGVTVTIASGQTWTVI